MCFAQSQYKGNHKGGAAEGRPPLWRRPKAASFVLALSKAHVLALNTAHVLRLNKADVLALNKAHVLHLNTKICPVLTANTKEAAFGRLHKGGGGLRPPPPFLLLGIGFGPPPILKALASTNIKSIGHSYY